MHLVKWATKSAKSKSKKDRKEHEGNEPISPLLTVAAGAVAGMSNQTVCHPFDTVRTRLQMNPVLKGPLDCIRGIISKEGWMAFYKGFTPPFLAQAFYKAILFTVNTTSQRLVREYNGGATLSLAQVFVCGAISGTTNSLVVTPVELTRNQLMMQIETKVYNGPPAVVRHVWSLAKGSWLIFARKMYTGWSATVARDSLGVGMYFLCFHVAKIKLSDSRTNPLRTHDLLLAGASAGVGFWSIALPFDGIKSQMQSIPVNRKPLTLYQALQKLGYRNLYRGWQVAIGRGIPGAAVTLTIYSICLDVFVRVQSRAV